MGPFCGAIRYIRLVEFASLARRISKRQRLVALEQQRHVQIGARLSRSLVKDVTQRVLEAEHLWTPAFKGAQHSLGNAWYTHLESGKERLYLRDAAKADAHVERVLPGLQAGVRALFEAFVDAPVRQRPGFCGAGVHIFLPDCPVARKGGSVHFDLEGLRSESERRARALSLVVMVQNADAGGGLRLWEARYTGRIRPSKREREAPYETVTYACGDAVFFESQRLHQIEPFRSKRARISITAHACKCEDGTWQAWF
jgi:hypothetical protein